MRLTSSPRDVRRDRSAAPSCRSPRAIDDFAVGCAPRSTRVHRRCRPSRRSPDRSAVRAILPFPALRAAHRPPTRAAPPPRSAALQCVNLIRSRVGTRAACRSAPGSRPCRATRRRRRRASAASPLRRIQRPRGHGHHRVQERHRHGAYRSDAAQQAKVQQETEARARHAEEGQFRPGARARASIGQLAHAKGARKRLAAMRLPTVITMASVDPRCLRA